MDRSAISKLRSERDRLDAQLAHLEGALAYFEAESPAQDSPSPPAKSMRNEMVRVLEEAGEPLHYKEIHRRLVARGFRVPGERPENNVGAHISKDERFESLGKGMWGLKSWNRPDLNESHTYSKIDLSAILAGAGIKASQQPLNEDASEATADELERIPF
jgi:DNA-directed RNA polymerase delta subunit